MQMKLHIECQPPQITLKTSPSIIIQCVFLDFELTQLQKLHKKTIFWKEHNFISILLLFKSDPLKPGKY